MVEPYESGGREVVRVRQTRFGWEAEFGVFVRNPYRRDSAKWSVPAGCEGSQGYRVRVWRRSRVRAEGIALAKAYELRRGRDDGWREASA